MHALVDYSHDVSEAGLYKQKFARVLGALDFCLALDGEGGGRVRVTSCVRPTLHINSRACDSLRRCVCVCESVTRWLQAWIASVEN